LRPSTKILLLVFLEILALTGALAYSQKVDVEGRAAVVKVLGLTDLFMSSDCYSTRNPSVVDFSGCFRDMPAQLCYHASCTALARPKFEGFNTTLEVEHEP